MAQTMQLGTRDSLSASDSLMKDVREMKLEVENLVSLVDKCVELASIGQHNHAFGTTHEGKNGFNANGYASNDASAYCYDSFGSSASSFSSGQHFDNSCGPSSGCMLYQDEPYPNNFAQQHGGFIQNNIDQGYACSPYQGRDYHGLYELQHNVYGDSFSHGHPTNVLEQQHDVIGQQHGFLDQPNPHVGCASSWDSFSYDFGQHVNNNVYGNTYDFVQQGNSGCNCLDCNQGQSYGNPHHIPYSQLCPFDHEQHESFYGGIGQQEVSNVGLYSIQAEDMCEYEEDVPTEVEDSSRAEDDEVNDSAEENSQECSSEEGFIEVNEEDNLEENEDNNLEGNIEDIEDQHKPLVSTQEDIMEPHDDHEMYQPMYEESSHVVYQPVHEGLYHHDDYMFIEDIHGRVDGDLEDLDAVHEDDYFQFENEDIVDTASYPFDPGGNDMHSGNLDSLLSLDDFYDGFPFDPGDCL